MSSNNVSGLGALSSVSGSFYRWLEDDVVDNITGVTMSIIFFVGMVLNVLVIRVLSSNNHRTMTSKPIFVQLIVIDFVAYLFVILPGIVAAFNDSVTFHNGVCVINGLCVTICWLGSFFFMTILCCERTIKLWKPTVHENGFEKSRHNVIIVLAVWSVCVGISALPLTGYGEADYIPLQQRCVLHDDNHIHMHLLFVFGIYIPSTIVCICGIFTYTHKRQIVLSLSKLNKQVESINMKLAKRADTNNTAPSPRRHSNERGDLSVSEIIDGSPQDICHTITESVPIQVGKSATGRDYKTISEPIYHVSRDDTPTDVTLDRDDVSHGIVSKPMTPRSVNDTKIEILSSGINRDKTKLSKVKVMFNVYQSSAEEMDVTLTVSYILMFLVVLCLWLPYVVLLYLDGDEGNVWGGWFSLVVLVSNISYCIKPVVYLSHNRVLKRAAVASFPESVRNRAAKTQEALKKISKKLDSLVFIQMPDTKSLIDLERDRVRVSPTT